MVKRIRDGLARLRPGLRLAGFVALPALLACAPPATPDPSLLSIRNVNVVDVRSGSVTASRTIRIRAGRIVAVETFDPGEPVAAGDLDGEGGFLIPGLWDMHVHTADAAYLARYVAHGIVGVRDMGGAGAAAGDGCESLRLDTLQALRREVLRGQRIGPRMVLSGPAASATGHAGPDAVRTPTDARRFVAGLVARKADFVKLYDGLPRPAFDALATAAATAGLPFAGHVPDSVSPLEAIHAGQRSIEHVRDPMLVCFARDAGELEAFFGEDAWGPEDRAWGRAAHARCDALRDALRAGSVWWTPTLAVEQAKVAVDEDDFGRSPGHGLLPASVRQGHADYAREKRAQTPADRASDRRWWALQRRAVARLASGEAQVLAGSDAACQGGVPGASLHEELALLSASGLGPLRALRAATLEPARYFGEAAERGSIGPGKQADLVLLDANPLEDIRNTRRIRVVVLGGRVHSAPALAALSRSP
jgi:imidazolonepropionase-like amidohydrolase